MGGGAARPGVDRMASLGRPKPWVLILSCDADVHVAPVTGHLDRWGVPWHRIDPGASAGEAFVEIQINKGRYVAELPGRRARSLDFGRIRSLWYRRPTDLSPPFRSVGADVRRFIASNRRAVLYGWLDQLACPWLPGRPGVEDRAANKTYQLSLASELGFRTPTTRITTSPEALVDLYSRFPQGIVVKPLVPLFNAERNAVQMFTRLVNRRELRGYISSLHAPMIVQERIPKRFDIRVTVVGDKVFTASIDSQSRNRTAVDFRHDIPQLRHEAHRLPASEAQRCVRLVRRLGLCFGAIDLILTPTGRYVFLEINPNGQWLWIEEQTGLPLAEAVASLLAEPARSRRGGS